MPDLLSLGDLFGHSRTKCPLAEQEKQIMSSFNLLGRGDVIHDLCGLLLHLPSISVSCLVTHVCVCIYAFCISRICFCQQFFGTRGGSDQLCHSGYFLAVA